LWLVGSLASNQWDLFVSALVGELVWTCLRDEASPASPIIVAMGVFDQPVFRSSFSLFAGCFLANSAGLL